MGNSGIKWGTKLRVGEIKLLLGEYRFNLDDKGRITIPSKFRKNFKDGIVVTKGFENCLFVFTNTDWQDFSTQIKNLKTLKKDARLLSRFIFGGAAEDAPDKQGRVMLPQNLREWAGISKEVVIIGVGNRLEVWSKGNWQKTEKQAAESFSDIAEELADLGF